MGTKATRDEAVMELIRELAKETKPIRFEGNNYSAEWQAEAKKRGLPILNSRRSAGGASRVFNDPKACEFLVKTKVLTEPEIHSRYHIAVERYNKTLGIELHTLYQMAVEYVVPAIETQITRSSAALDAMKLPAPKAKSQERVAKLEQTFEQVMSNLSALKVSLDKINEVEDETKKMKAIAAEAIPLAKKLRDACDAAEVQVADEVWPLPKYREMLFANTIS